MSRPAEVRRGLPFDFIRTTILCAIALVPLTLRFNRESKFADGSQTGDNLSSRARVWQRSVACSLRTGTFLTICDEAGGAHPIEEASPADDRGHALLLTAWSMFSMRIPSPSDITRLNLAFNASALLLTGAAFWSSGLPLLAFLFVFLGAHFVIPGFRQPDSAASFAGLYCLIVAAGITLSSLLGEKPGGGRSFSLKYALLLFWVGFISLMRQPLGVCAALFCSTLSAIAGRRPARGNARGRLRSAALLLGPWLALCAPHALTASRDLLFAIPRSGIGIATHGLGHALLLGLGEESNPFGIRWDDSYGEALVGKERPGIHYLSAGYFRFAWRRYFGILLGSPIEVAKIYLRKTHTALHAMAMDGLGFFIVILWLSYFAASDTGSPHASKIHCAFPCVLFGTSAAVVLSQGIFGWPYPIYIYPSYMGFIFFKISLALAARDMRETPLAACALLWALAGLSWGFLHPLQHVFGPDIYRFLEASNLAAELGLTVLSALFFLHRWNMRVATAASHGLRSSIPPKQFD